MKVLKRQQITNVKILRQVSHTLELNGSIYHRYENKSVEMPYMDCELSDREPTIKWQLEVGKRVVRDLSAKEVKNLGLETLFDEIDLNSRNGN